MAGEAAQAASPTYCALYGREYGLATVQPAAAPGMLASVQNQAYYRCLNQDEDPPLPKTSAYFGTDVSKLTETTASAEGVDLGPVPPIPNARPKQQPEDRSIASAAGFPAPATAKPTADRNAG